MNESNSPSQERDGQPDGQQTDTDPADTAAAPVDTDTEPEDQIDAALAEADAALTRATESHDDYREAITDATVTPQTSRSPPPQQSYSRSSRKSRR